MWRNDPFVARLRNFIDLDPSDLRSLRDVIETELTVKKRRDLVLDGYEFSKLGFIKQGFAARYKLLRNGKRQIINFLLPGDVVGMPGSFLDRAANSVIAVTDMRLQSLPARCLRGAVLPPAEVRAGAELARGPGDRHLRRAHHQYRAQDADRAARSSSARNSFAARRGRQCRRGGIRLPFTQEMMSDALGLSVPHLNRTLTRLRAEGMIAVNERRVEFIDPKSMALLAQFQPINPGRIPICGGN